jgi:hypothetical protein
MSYVIMIKTKIMTEDSTIKHVSYGSMKHAGQ